MIPNLAVYLVSLKSLTSLNFTYGICNSQQMYSFSWKRVDVASLLQFGSGLPECNTGGGERSGMEEREKERERERERESYLLFNTQSTAEVFIGAELVKSQLTV